MLADPWNKIAKLSVAFEQDDAEQLSVLIRSTMFRCPLSDGRITSSAFSEFCPY